MRILLIDGQGGGIGRALAENVRAALPEAEIVAVGTNSIATSSMMKAGAAMGATGENAVIWNAGRSDVILGPIGVFFPHAMMGEITPAMAEALTGSRAHKIAVPVNRCNVHVVGIVERPLREYIAEAVEEVRKLAAGS